MSVEKLAINLARLYFESEGFDVDDVSRKRGHNGYDFLIRSGDGQLTVEVKGCSRMWHIPDLYETEFDAGRRLVADFICVVYFIDGCEPQICVVPRDGIPPEVVKPKSGYRISSSFKKQQVLEKYLRPLPPGIGAD